MESDSGGDVAMDVSIIIVNYHSSRLIADCIDSIGVHTRDLEYEVIVVDNDSEPDFKETILSLLHHPPLSGIKFLSLSENIGFGRANNQGLKTATGRNILFLNPDTLLMNNAVKILSDFLDNNSRAGACGPNILDESQNPAFSFKRFLPGIFWEFNELLNYYPQKLKYGQNTSFNHTGKPLEVGYATGAALMVKKEVLDKVGAFRDEFFLYYEETDLCYRIRKAGWKIFNVPEAEIIHLESKSFTKGEEWQSETKTKYIEESRKIYYRLNSPLFQKKLSDLIYSAFLHSRHKLLRSPGKKEYYGLRRKYFRSL